MPPQKHPIMNRFLELLKQKELAEGRDIPLVEVELRTNVTRKTLQMWRDNKVKRYDRDVIKALCDYFECGVGNLLVYDGRPASGRTIQGEVPGEYRV